MAEKCSLSIKRLLQISLAIMLLFLLIISVLYYLFIYDHAFPRKAPTRNETRLVLPQ